MKAYWGVEVLFHALLISVLDGGEWSASHPNHFMPREKVPHTLGQYVGWAPEHFKNFCNFSGCILSH
jgi:hypothetical protein